MAVGVIFIARTPGYNQELMSYLFGNILMVRPDDLKILLALDLVVVGVRIVFTEDGPDFMSFIRSRLTS